MTDTMIGRTLNGRYKITERVGVGGMAEVYRAQDTVLGRSVAIKVMLQRYAEDEAFSQKFKQEAAAVANLSSPYIVNVYDWGQDSGTYYIVMEYVRGTDLKTGIKQRGALNQRKVAEIGSQVCQALQVAHKQDIIHCDIKPQNIMVQPDGNVKVMDFGISKAKNSLEAKSSTVLGTAHYISPEQAQGKELTPASDIYSLGIVLFEAATGTLPFDGPDAVSVATMQVQNEAPLPGDINPKLDPRLEAIIVRAMQKDPRKRYASANEMRMALNDFLAGRSRGASSLSAAETALLNTGDVRDAQGGSGGTVGMTAVMPANAVGANNKPGARTYSSNTHAAGSNHRSASRSNEPSPAPSRRGFIIGAIVALVVIAIAVVFAFKSCSGTSEDMRPVPSVVGKTSTEATTLLREAGFTLGTIDKSYDTSVASGTVISQDPVGGASRPAGSKINIVVSLGAEEVIVPPLENMTAAEAQKALAEAGLVARAGTAQYSSDVEVNKVISQSPAAGSTVKKGTEVEYILSLGEENIAVPNVIGTSQSAATRELQNSGFKVSVTESYSESIEAGLVINQSPHGGKLEKGGTVTIEVSKGPDPANAPIDIPSVVNMTVYDAKHTLENAGFSVHVTGSSEDYAIVRSQNPTGTAKRGSTITIHAEAAAPPESGTSEE